MVGVLLSCCLTALGGTIGAGVSGVDIKLPIGWIPNPTLAHSATVVWVRSSAAGAESLNAFAIPLADAQANVVMARIRANVAQRDLPVWDTQAWMCGALGYILNSTFSGSLPYNETIVERSAGALYVFAYSRAAGVRSDPQTEAFMRTACPASMQALLTLTPPQGWQARTVAETLGAWQDLRGDAVILDRTSLQDVVRSASLLPSGNAGEPSHQTFATCGDTGLQWDVSARTGSQRSVTTMFAILAQQSAYLIYYMHAAAADPSVVNAIRAFCPPGSATVGLTEKKLAQ